MESGLLWERSSLTLGKVLDMPSSIVRIRSPHYYSSVLPNSVGNPRKLTTFLLWTDDVIYTALELSNEVSSHTLPALPEGPSLLSILPSLPEGSVPADDMLLGTLMSLNLSPLDSISAYDLILNL